MNFAEIMTIGLILGASAIAVFVAKLKLQPTIELEIFKSEFESILTH